MSRWVGLSRWVGVWATQRDSLRPERLTRLCREVEARGNLVLDAHLAALAVEQGATWYSADRGFARFAGLRWRHPLDE